ncbi:MAG: flavodoxin [Aerococcus sp.]|nr:flavodoxin [Aerococcus sp.]
MKAIVAYASLTGNTMEAADVITGALEALDVDVEMLEAEDVYGEDFLEVDICLIGTYTYGAEIPETMIDLYEDLNGLDLTGKVFGTFGSGDHAYEAYCQSVYDFYDQLLKTHAAPGGEPVTVELAVDREDIAPLEQLAKHCVEVAESLS